jgi:ribosomal protein L7Ae-like RNA K-turn-binding protein
MLVSEKFLSLLGLAAAAGKVSSGNTAVEEAFKKNKVKLLLLAGDCAENTINEYKKSAEKANICYYILDTAELGKSIGKPERKAVCITDNQFAQVLEKQLGLLNNFGGVGQ